MTRITLTSGSTLCQLDASVEREIHTLLSGEGSKTWFSAEEAAEQISSLIDIEVELNDWTDVKVAFAGVPDVAQLLEVKLNALGFTTIYWSGRLKAV